MVGGIERERGHRERREGGEEREKEREGMIEKDRWRWRRPKHLDYIGKKSPWAGKFRVGGRVHQVGRTKGCWENLKARSSLVGKTSTSAPCSEETKQFCLSCSSPRLQTAAAQMVTAPTYVSCLQSLQSAWQEEDAEGISHRVVKGLIKEKGGQP